MNYNEKMKKAERSKREPIIGIPNGEGLKGTGKTFTFEINNTNPDKSQVVVLGTSKPEKDLKNSNCLKPDGLIAWGHDIEG